MNKGDDKAVPDKFLIDYKLLILRNNSEKSNNIKRVKFNHAKSSTDKSKLLKNSKRKTVQFRMISNIEKLSKKEAKNSINNKSDD